MSSAVTGIKMGSKIVFFDRRHPFMNSKAVIMAYSGGSNAVKYFVAIILKDLEKRKVLLASDPSESAKLSAGVINRKTDDTIFHKYHVRMRRWFEGHFTYKMLDNSALRWVEYYANLLGLEMDTRNAAEYVSEKVILPEPVLVKPDITYFKHLFISYLVVCFIQFILFLIERWVSNRDYNRISPGEQLKIQLE